MPESNDKPPSAALRQRVLGAVDPETRFDGFGPRLATFLDLPPAAIRELLAAIGAAPRAPWQATGLAGVARLPVSAGARLRGADCALLHIEPERRFPPHRHLGDEWALVLQGQAQEDDGQRFQAGDLVFKPAGSEHRFRTLPGEPCVLALALRGGLEWIE